MENKEKNERAIRDTDGEEQLEEREKQREECRKLLEEKKLAANKKKRGQFLYVMAAGVAKLAPNSLWTSPRKQEPEISVLEASFRDLPAGFSGFRIAQISDLHNTEYGEGNSVLLRRLAQTEADIIVITGDIIDGRRTNADVALAFARGAAEIAPTYYVTGNHEIWFDELDEFVEGLEAAGVTVLADDAVTLLKNGDEISLLGLADPDTMLLNDVEGDVRELTEGRLRPLLRGAKEFTLLLSHRPELFPVYAACGVRLTFCGHAHGGQIRLPLVGGLFAPLQGMFPKYDAGLYAQGDSRMILSRGLGNSLFPFRFRNRPEIVLAKLTREEA